MKPTRCTLHLSIFISTSVHVSGSCVPIIRRTYCIYATVVFFTVYGWLSGLLHPYIIFFKWSQLGTHYFSVYLFQLLYMSRATMCPSSGELTVSMQHWYFSLCMGGCLVSRTGELTVSMQHWYFLFCMGGCLVSYFNFSTCFGQLCAHHQENLLYLCDAGIFLLCMGGCLLQQTRQPPIQSEKYQCRIDTVSSPDDGHIVARNM